MATTTIPTDAEVLKQVRKCLSLDDADDVTVSSSLCVDTQYLNFVIW
jgi:hypothetical protein